MGNTLVKEYMLSKDELNQKYPINSVHIFNNKKYIVLRHEEPMAATNFASYPRVIFKLLK